MKIHIFVSLLILTACHNKEELTQMEADKQIQGYKLVWADEFTEAVVDTNKWEFQVGDGRMYGLPGGWGNEELQWYTKNNCEIRNGNLIIKAKKEEISGFNYSSTRLRSLNNGDWKYGRFEIRAKLPKGLGLWPAIWMLPSELNYGGWAASGEIDIMEMHGHEYNKVYGTLHYGGQWPENIKHGTSYKLPEGDFNSKFHTFCIEWEEGEFRWYVDGTHYQTLNEWYSKGNKYPAPFDQPFHLLLNVAVGGRWVGNPNSTTIFPQEMVVDYVRVYEKI